MKKPLPFKQALKEREELVYIDTAVQEIDPDEMMPHVPRRTTKLGSDLTNKFVSTSTTL